MSLVRGVTGTKGHPTEPADMTVQDWLFLHFEARWQSLPVCADTLVFTPADMTGVIEISEFYVDPILVLT